MTRRERIDRLSETKEDAVLLAHIADRIETARSRNVPAATAFLSPREQELARRLLGEEGLAFFGGFPGAERCVLCAVPDYLDEEDFLTGEDGPVCALRAEFYGGDTLSHRDFLGALMGCGVRRETVGDILVGEGSCDFLVTRELAPYILQNLESAGRTKLRLKEISLGELRVPEPEKKELRGTVASLRLDSVAALGFGLARGKAAAYISAGAASVNHLVCDKPDRLLEEGDTVSVRGLGKIELTAVGGTTKKGRTGVTVSRFV